MNCDNLELCYRVQVNSQMLKHGGKRYGSGPKKPMSPYGEKTSVIRIPTSIKPALLSALDALKSNLQGLSTNSAFKLPVAVLNAAEILRPIYSGTVAAGQSRFPSPAQDYEQEELDLNKLLVRNAPATFFFRVGNSYDSMIDVGIFPNSLLIIDRSLNAKSSNIVLAAVEGELIVKRLFKSRNAIELRSENKAKGYPPIVFKDGGQELVIEGVVRFNVNSL